MWIGVGVYVCYGKRCVREKKEEERKQAETVSSASDQLGPRHNLHPHILGTGAMFMQK